MDRNALLRSVTMGFVAAATMLCAKGEIKPLESIMGITPGVTTFEEAKKILGSGGVVHTMKKQEMGNYAFGGNTILIYEKRGIAIQQSYEDKTVIDNIVLTADFNEDPDESIRAGISAEDFTKAIKTRYEYGGDISGDIVLTKKNATEDYEPIVEFKAVVRDGKVLFLEMNRLGRIEGREIVPGKELVNSKMEILDEAVVIEKRDTNAADIVQTTELPLTPEEETMLVKNKKIAESTQTDEPKKN